jgi:phosphohistidine phosphatase SixA
MKPLIKNLLALLGFLLCMTQANSADVLQQGNIILFRHANAPGVGDPANFKIGDCTTQRNLDDVGRSQAKRIGEYLRANSVKVNRVFTSQWCRCKETASLAFPDLPTGAMQENAAFNSFFSERQQEPKATAAAKALLLAWKGPGHLVVVTHQVNISAITGAFSQSGEGIVLQRQGKELKVVGRVAP